jgi:hypothetical protein
MKTNQKKYKTILDLCNKFFSSASIKGNELTYIKICSKITNSIEKTQSTFDYKVLLKDLKDIRDKFKDTIVKI